MSDATSSAPPDHDKETALVQRLVSHHGGQWVDSDNAQVLADRPGDTVMFFSGDPVRFPEGQDVAVVLPELQKAFPGRLQLGVVRREHEDAVARRWGVQRWPSLVFLREGAYVATLPGMWDWTDYVGKVAEALAQPTSRAPGIGIPLVSASQASASSCH